MSGLIKAANELQTARFKLDAAMIRARKAATVALSEGVSEAEIARALGVNRMTVRRWLGKL